MTDDVTKIKSVRAIGGRKLRVEFAGEDHGQEIDLTELLARSKHFAPLIHDADGFAHAEIVEDGLGVGWQLHTKWGRLEVSASTLKRIADDQRP